MALAKHAKSAAVCIIAEAKILFAQQDMRVLVVLVLFRVSNKIMRFLFAPARVRGIVGKSAQQGKDDALHHDPPGHAMPEGKIVQGTWDVVGVNLGQVGSIIVAPSKPRRYVAMKSTTTCKCRARQWVRPGPSNQRGHSLRLAC